MVAFFMYLIILDIRGNTQNIGVSITPTFSIQYSLVLNLVAQRNLLEIIRVIFYSEIHVYFFYTLS